MVETLALAASAPGEDGEPVVRFLKRRCQLEGAFVLAQRRRAIVERIIRLRQFEVSDRVVRVGFGGAQQKLPRLVQLAQPQVGTAEIAVYPGGTERLRCLQSLAGIVE